ncbi:MAG: methionine biosynthesis protein MetW [Parvibaculum sp.]|jgi:methionine biosynthesis protein MetW|uniref:methionine biosynthesis protein MetW n=1 Tax=Parvibaculum sp. TaxID=2024848 RepID=UPI00284EFDDF|nr:methionine biosynthesis protein MetW [Parvibaculum sp.]MDR3500295.1 methionine biosynthesis protein MetW [Parvibaculum sp.]
MTAQDGTSAFGYVQNRVDLALIAEMIAPDARVLDVGCGDGQLLALLARTKNVDGRGIELSQEGVNACVARGLSVIQGDADADLHDYPDDAFDYVILSQTIQATRNPREVLTQMKRIGRHVVVSFPNFGNWRVRLQLLWSGRMPVTRTLGHDWYDTPNIHLCTVRDFVSLCDDLGLNIDDAVSVIGNRARRVGRPGSIDNLTAEDAVLLLSRKS